MSGKAGRVLAAPVSWSFPIRPSSPLIPSIELTSILTIYHGAQHWPESF